jgi:hypothetical protein
VYTHLTAWDDGKVAVATYGPDEGDKVGRLMAKAAMPHKNACRTDRYGTNNTTSRTRWNCGCETHSDGRQHLCPHHAWHGCPPTILRELSVPCRVDGNGRGTENENIFGTVLKMDTEHLKKIRRRCEDALRKAGTGEVIRCAEMLRVLIDG